MIKVKRTHSADIISELNKKGKDQLTERERAVNYFIHKSITKKPTFKAYKTDKVKEELNKMFRKKCAYCESRYAHIAPMDVEHFRPKGAYVLPDGKKSKIGYFWLAAEWKNLLPSCIDCNRERKQVRRKDNGQLIKSKSGKANKFPLEDESKRANLPDDEKNESPLLIDPCEDRISKYLVFFDDGSVRVKNSKINSIQLKGFNTIEVFGLDRKNLHDERKSVSMRLRAQMEDVVTARYNLFKDENDPVNKKFYERALKELRSFQSVNAQYLAMTKALIRIFEKVLELSIDYIRLKLKSKDFPDDKSIENEMEVKLRAIKKYRGDDKQASNIVMDVVELLQLMG